MQPTYNIRWQCFVEINLLYFNLILECDYIPFLYTYADMGYLFRTKNGITITSIIRTVKELLS